MNESINKPKATVPGMNSQFAAFPPLELCNLETHELMENSARSTINTVCGDYMVRNGGKKPRIVSAFTKLTV